MKTSIVLHHSAISDSKPQARRIITAHLKNPKILQSGAYHWIAEMDGRNVQLHEEEYIGHHAGNWAMNLVSIGVCLAGNFVIEKPTDAQILGMTKLLMDIQTRWGISDDEIYLHREVRLSPTACPGIDLRAIYFAKRTELLKTKVTRLKQVEERVTGIRLARIKRAIAYFKSLIP